VLFETVNFLLCSLLPCFAAVVVWFLWFLGSWFFGSALVLDLVRFPLGFVFVAGLCWACWFTLTIFWQQPSEARQATPTLRQRSEKRASDRPRTQRTAAVSRLKPTSRGEARRRPERHPEMLKQHHVFGGASVFFWNLIRIWRFLAYTSNFRPLDVVIGREGNAGGVFS
jgi:hypothetical protein